MSLRIPEKNSDSGAMIGSKSGALIVSTYLVQALTGLVVSLGLAYTIMPDLFKASGILLPMAYGQGPGQANNVGTTYEALGMASGRTFGLSLAATGYLCACVVGVIFLNLYNRKNKLERIRDKEEVSGSVTIDTFQNNDEIPISESVDKLSIQFALVALVYLLTYWLTRGINNLITMVAPGAAGTVSTLLWGFNFIIGSIMAILLKAIIKWLQKTNIMKRQYQNNYLLSRISGLAFDIMIIAGIASIDFDDISGLWIPFALTSIIGGIVTFAFLKFICNKIYPNYKEEGFLSMFGMLTGTISSGILLLREIDPDFETPAANNLVSGSGTGIAFGAPVLVLVSLAPKSTGWCFGVVGLATIYLAILLFMIFKLNKKAKSVSKDEAEKLEA
jgi:ESS family glutamate:Na+ symporter